jgi:hypothetical protein
MSVCHLRSYSQSMSASLALAVSPLFAHMRLDVILMNSRKTRLVNAALDALYRHLLFFKGVV